MDRRAVLAAFDEQIRRHPGPDAPDGQVEHDGGVVRSVSGGDGWNGVTWCDLDRVSADAVIAAQISRFAELARPWEWKHYSYDQPPDLPERLLAAGFTPEPAEALLVAEIADLTLDVPPPPGVELRAVVDRQGVEALVAVHDEVFGGDHSALGRALLAGLGAPADHGRGRRRLRPGRLRSPRGAWSSTPAPTSPASGAAARCRPGGAAACSARWSPTGPRWRRPEASATSRSTPPRTADRSSSDSASSSSPRRRRSPIPAGATRGSDRVCSALEVGDLVGVALVADVPAETEAEDLALPGSKMAAWPTASARPRAGCRPR